MLVAAVMGGGIAALAGPALPPPEAVLRLVQSIPLPHVDGRIDHMAVDVAGQRLFVAALGNDTLEVVDLEAARVARSVDGFSEPQGVAYLSDMETVVVANGGDGTLAFVDAKTLRGTKKLALGDDADNVRYDASNRRIYVGYGGGALAIIDASTGARAGDIPLAGHPESFQLDPSAARVFVNVPSASSVAVVDTAKGRVAAAWPLSGVAANFPMAVDAEHHRLFVGTRRPARVLVLDMESGKAVATLEAEADTDDLFYDASRRRVYGVFGGGAILAWTQVGADEYVKAARIPTAPGARTGLFSPDLHRLFVAVPRRGATPAEIRVFASP
jgi:hypothetical protein